MPSSSASTRSSRGSAGRRAKGGAPEPGPEPRKHEPQAEEDERESDGNGGADAARASHDPCDQKRIERGAGQQEEKCDGQQARREADEVLRHLFTLRLPVIGCRRDDEGRGDRDESEGQEVHELLRRR